MSNPDRSYVDTLADQLRHHRPDLLELAEDELQTLRDFKATVARFIHNQAIPRDIRVSLARDLGLPEPPA